ncbi:MAG: energy-coupling factor transporter transmembrane protein EcfT, partial [Angustibacter sp.]
MAKLGASTALALGLLLSVDIVSSAVALLGELLLLPWCGIRPRALIRRLAWLLLGAVPAALAALAFGEGPPLT